MKLLTRDAFREGVFQRDNYKCVFCGNPAQDAHHIMERRLWIDGGYYLNNGASVCGDCHIKCETTEYSVEDVREAAKIDKKIIPEHLYGDHVYDKWGNTILEDGRRMKGELFNDESVQKILDKGGVLPLFTNYVKYPRTYHLPWSPGATDDDRMIKDLSCFKGKEIVMTMKMDGENTNMYSNYIHARSIDGRNHWTRNWVKNYWSSIAHNIPPGWRICAENLYAKHSIEYFNLDSYVYGFSIWDEKNTCLSWENTLEWFELLGIKPVHVLYEGIFDEDIIKNHWHKTFEQTNEGYVVRNKNEFHYKDFRNNVGKYVRKNHVQTIQHWMHGNAQEINSLRKDYL